MNGQLHNHHSRLTQASLWSPSAQSACQCLSLIVDVYLKFSNTTGDDMNQLQHENWKSWQQAAGFCEVSESNREEPLARQKASFTREEPVQSDWLTMEMHKTSRQCRMFKKTRK